MQPKPVSLTQVSEEDYDGAFEPQPLVVVGPVPGGGGRGGGSAIQSADGSSGVTASNNGILTLTSAADGKVEVTIISNGTAKAAIIADAQGNPVDSSIVPSGIVLHADLVAFARATDLDNVFTTLNERVPAPPATGAYRLQSVDGVVSWVSA